MTTEKQIMPKSIDPMTSEKEGTHIPVMDHLKKTWICLGCDRSFLLHYEIVNHMHSENHLVMLNSSIVQDNGIPQAAEIRNTLLGVFRN
jgi:hypothetical protein